MMRSIIEYVLVAVVIIGLFSTTFLTNIVNAKGGYGARINSADSYIWYSSEIYGDKGVVEVGLVIFDNTTLAIEFDDPGGAVGIVIEINGITWWEYGGNTSSVSIDFVDGQYYVIKIEWIDTRHIKLYVNNIYIGLFYSSNGITVCDITIGDTGEYIWSDTGKTPSGTMLVDYVYIDVTRTSSGEKWELYDDLNDLSKVDGSANVEIVDVSQYVDVATTTTTTTVTTTVTSTVTNTTTVTSTVTDTVTTTIANTTTVTETLTSTVTNTTTLFNTTTITSYDTVTLTATTTYREPTTIYLTTTEPVTNTIVARPVNYFNPAYILVGLLILFIIIAAVASKH